MFACYDGRAQEILEACLLRDWAVPDEIAQTEGYGMSLQRRKRIEQGFGWAKTIAGLSKARHRGLAKIDWQFTFAMAAYNLVRMRTLAQVRPQGAG